MNPIVEQYAVELDLGWVEGDPISLAWRIEDDDGVTDLDWSGTYRVQIRTKADTSSPLLATLDMYGDHVGLGTDFTIAGDASDSAGVKTGTWYWDAQLVGGTTRFSGLVRVKPQVTG